MRHTAPVQDVAEQLRQLGCEPIEGMAKLAADDTVPTVLRARMFAELATYIAPRRKAIGLSGPNARPIEAECSLDDSVLSVAELETVRVLLEKAMRGGAE